MASRSKLKRVGGSVLPPRTPTSDILLAQLLAQRKQFLAFVQRRVSDFGLAEDILQTAYLRAYQHQDDFQESESAVGWFYRLLRNAVIDSYRRQETKSKALEALTRVLEMDFQAAPDLYDDICGCLHSVLDTLKPHYSEILRAVDLGEQPVQDFAKQHNLSASNAGVRAHRARAALRKQLIETCSSCADHGCLNCTCKRR